MAKKKTPQAPKNDFAPVEDLDICSFSSEPIVTGECISSFSFDDSTDDNALIYNEEINSTANSAVVTKSIDFNLSSTTGNKVNTSSNNKDKIHNKDILRDNRKSPIANGIAPPINGEYLDVKRTYMLRSSTVRKLNELKSIHPELNTYVSTIVDIAIAHYYNHVINEGGKQ